MAGNTERTVINFDDPKVIESILVIGAIKVLYYVRARASFTSPIIRRLLV